jgi:uncharacterized protein (DUF2147 family)
VTFSRIYTGKVRSDERGGTDATPWATLSKCLIAGPVQQTHVWT